MGKVHATYKCNYLQSRIFQRQRGGVRAAAWGGCGVVQGEGYYIFLNILINS